MSKNNIILLHGALGAAAQMTELFDLLSTDYNVYTFDFHGHGGRDLPPDGLSIRTFSDELCAFIQKNDLNGATIFGYSMGGYVALASALRHDNPAKPGNIITLGTKFDWSPESASREASFLNPEKWEAKIPHFAEMLRQRHAPQDWKLLVSATADMLIGLGNGEAFSYQDLTHLQLPVFIMVGELDNMVSQEESQMAAQHLPNGQLVSLPETKHPFEQVNMAQLAVYIKKCIAAPLRWDGMIMGSLLLNFLL